MTVIAKEGVVFKSKAKVVGGSFDLRIPREVWEYLGLADDTEIAIKLENGKYGPYVGIGILKIEDAKEGE